MIRIFTLILLLLASMITHAAAKILTSYTELAQAVEQGDNVRAIIHFDKCIGPIPPSKDIPPMEPSSTRMNFTIYSHYKVAVGNQEKYTVATSNMILTEHHSLGPIYAYARLRVFEDNTAEFHTAYYDPQTFTPKGQFNLHCRISNGTDQNGVVLVD